MNYHLPPVFIDLDHRVAPTEIRVQVTEPNRQLCRRDCGIEPSMIFKHQSQSPLIRLSQRYQTNRMAPGKSLLTVRMPFIPHSITAAASACSTLCPCIRAIRFAAPIKSKLAKNGISIFITDCQSSLFSWSTIGKGYANPISTQAAKNSNNQRQFQAVLVLITRSDEGKVTTHRHAPKC